MKTFFITIAGVFCGLLLFFVLIPVLLVTSVAVSSGPPPTPGKTVLVLDLRQAISDQPSLNPLSSLSGGGGLAVTDVVRKLELAESDRSVKGVFIRAPEMGMAPAHAEELRQALISFQASDRFVIAHSQGFENPTITNYVAVSAAEELWMQPASSFASTGLVAETLFLGGLMERFGLIAQFEQFYEFKNAANTYLERDFTDAHREATTSMLTSIYNSALAAVAFDREMPVERAKQALDAAPLQPDAAKAAGLIDEIGMPEDASDAALTRAGGVESAELVAIEDYIPPTASGPLIALVGGEGAILTGTNGIDPFSGNEAIMAGDPIAEAIRDATDDRAVKAIVLRVSSPGGSPVASEQIWAAVERAKAEGKPVVVSMGAYAASGGYYVAAGADEILAMPSTITGSIGVLGGKIVVDQALNRYTGANIGQIGVGGPYGSAFSSAEPFTNAQRAAFRASMAQTYADFTAKVAAGRQMTAAQVETVARGRVWTGQQASTNGLVDTVGGLRRATRLAAELAGEDASEPVRLRLYPEAQDPLEMFADLLGVGAGAVRGAAILGALSNDPQVEAMVSMLGQQRTQGAQLRDSIQVR